MNGRTTSGSSDIASARAALKEVEAVAASLDMFSSQFENAPDLLPVGERRRRLRAGDPDPIATVSLVLNDEGVLLWTDGAPRATSPGRSLRRGRTLSPEGDLVELYQYEQLEPNEINSYLTRLDTKLNGNSGLRQLKPVKASAQVEYKVADAPLGKKRRLVLVHGTFSKSEALIESVMKAPNGPEFLKRVFAHYDEVLVFDHPTISVSPVLNAFDLACLMTNASGPLDIVAHSRGGLVTRWFLEGFGAAAGTGPYRGVLVGSPLGGTSLAAPPQLRDSLSMLSNIGNVLKAGGTAAVVYFPLIAVPLALLKVATSVVSVAAKTPIIDAAVSMIPGLAGQSRVALNHEIDRIHAITVVKPPTYFVVQSNFETDAAGWQFWKWFRPDKLKDAGADKLFPGDNDLVVDTKSMSDFTGSKRARIVDTHDFGTSNSVHHTNYFEQPQTLDFILEKLDVP